MEEERTDEEVVKVEEDVDEEVEEEDGSERLMDGRRILRSTSWSMELRRWRATARALAAIGSGVKGQQVRRKP